MPGFCQTMAIMCSGSAALGMGHIMRTLVIAENLKNDFSIYYICKKEPEYETGAKELKKRGFAVYYECENTPADILLLDSYDKTEEDLSRLRKKYKKLVYIDDLHKLPFYDCDILINKNYGAENLIYNVPDNCKTLLGAGYSLLREEFLKVSSAPSPEKVKNVLITMGGTDPKNTSVKILEILKNTPYNFFAAVGAGFSEKTKKSLEKLAGHNKNITLFYNPKMAALISKCHLAVTAGGGTVYEIASLGVPQIVTAVADNQVPPLSFGEDNGLFLYGGKEEEIIPDKFLFLFESLAKDYKRRKFFSENEKRLINKNGVNLVANEIKELAAKK